MSFTAEYTIQKKRVPIRIKRIRVGHNAGLFKAHAYGMTWYGKSKQEIMERIPKPSNSYGKVMTYTMDAPPF